MTGKTHSKQQIVNSKEQRVLLFAVCYLLCAVCYGQGFLPPKASSSSATNEAKGPLLIGDKVPEHLKVADQDGKKRGLLTYKSPLEVMVVVVFTSNCAEQEARWKEIARFYEAYKDWRVSFVALYIGGLEARDAFAKRLVKTYPDVPLLTEEDHAVTELLNVQFIPELVIIDESGDLRYRGPVGKDARKAIEAVISHLEPVANPEPASSTGCPIP
jgi:AhpC/TSA family protein